MVFAEKEGDDLRFTIALASSVHAAITLGFYSTGKGGGAALDKRYK